MPTTLSTAMKARRAAKKLMAMADLEGTRTISFRGDAAGDKEHAAFIATRTILLRRGYELRHAEDPEVEEAATRPTIAVFYPTTDEDRLRPLVRTALGPMVGEGRVHSRRVRKAGRTEHLLLDVPASRLEEVAATLAAAAPEASARIFRGG